MATSPLFGWEEPDDTDLVKDGAAAIRTLGNAIDTSMGDLLGGTSGQVLSKNSNTNMDFTWVTSDDANAIQNAIVDAKGDLITATAADTPARLAVGATNGMTLQVDSTTATGLKWAAPAGGGKVLQVVQATTSTQVINSTTTFADTGLTASITPSLSTSKVLVMVSQMGCRRTAGGSTIELILNLFRGATDIALIAGGDLYTATTLQQTGALTYAYLDSPATTSATTYKTQFKNADNVASVRVQTNSDLSTIILMEIGA